MSPHVINVYTVQEKGPESLNGLGETETSLLLADNGGGMHLID